MRTIATWCAWTLVCMQLVAVYIAIRHPGQDTTVELLGLAAITGVAMMIGIVSETPWGWVPVGGWLLWCIGNPVLPEEAMRVLGLGILVAGTVSTGMVARHRRMNPWWWGIAAFIFMPTWLAVVLVEGKELEGEDPDKEA